MHELHSDYPLALENSHAFSNYCNNIVNDFGIKIDNVNKLVPNLGDKSKYVLLYKNLQLYLSLGIKLHKFIEFKILNNKTA